MRNRVLRLGLRHDSGLRHGCASPRAPRSAIALLWLALALGPGAAAGQQPTCVTLCEQKVDACADRCEALGDAVYRDPASLRQCQLACAKQLFVACVERCTRTGEVVEDDYGIVAEDPDHLPGATENQP